MEKMGITYRFLDGACFNAYSLDSFIRRQEVAECWRFVEGKWKLLPIAYVEDWDLDQRRERAAAVCGRIKAGGFACGAFSGDELVGFALINAEAFGSRGQYLDLEEFHVSEPFRNQGIGGTLFRMAAEKAKVRGAEKLYISAHSARETMEAYRKLGCVFAEEINRELAEKEPCDVQLEYVL